MDSKALLLNREVTTVWLTLRTLQVAAVGAGLWTVVINPMPQWRVPPSLHILSTVLIASSFVLSWLLDEIAPSAFQYSALLTYGSIVTYVASSHFLHRQQASLIPVVGEWITLWATISGAAAITIPVELLSHVLGRQSQHPSLPWATLAPTLPLLAFTGIHVFYLINRALTSGTISATHANLPPPRYLIPTFASAFLSAVFISKLGFAIGSSWTDLAVSTLLYIGCMKGIPSGAIDVPTRTGATRTLRTYLKVIMENEESRKIFYFLMVNLAYMVIQLLWGFWTNSLGLVSDAIHMFFDCLSVGGELATVVCKKEVPIADSSDATVGLMASVMANWPPNESFTYGYGRIETISGFANGIFLILISIFIAFEAVQRIIDPPEM
ncbi:putative zinc transporter msc2, partial [Tulasnella sp. 427]